MSEVELPWRGGLGTPKEEQAQRALRAGLVRFQQDACRCLPRRRDRPVEITAQLHVIPSQGELVMTYQLAPPSSEAKEELSVCLGEPTVSFAPFEYGSDMITEDGRVSTFDYPIKIELGDQRIPRRRSQRKRARP